MRFSCGICHRDFTIINERDKKKVFNIQHFILNKMHCPNCGAGAGNANIVLHADCRKRLSGSPLNIDGFQVHCEGCPSIFNCFTGNVDDGHIEPLKETAEHLKEEANKRLDKIKQDVDTEKATQLKTNLKAAGVSFRFAKQYWYLKFLNTIWKLGHDDVLAILNDTWDTERTRIVAHVLTKKRISLLVVTKVFKMEMSAVERSG